MQKHYGPSGYVNLKEKRKMVITDEQLSNWFTYHSPNPAQNQAYQNIRTAGLELAQMIRDNAPDSADCTAAIRKVREAVMTANQAIACGGK
jgi:hypothetical protein